MSNGIGPGGWLISTENAKVCFNFLIDMFSFSICLWVIGGQEGKIVL